MIATVAHRVETDVPHLLPIRQDSNKDARANDFR